MFIPNPLKVRVVLHPPSVITKDSGSDIQLIKELAKILQTELELSHSDNPLGFGYLQPNGTITGAFGAVYYQKVDLAIGTLLLNQDRYRLLDTSFTYHNERWYWCVPRATKMPSWKQVFVAMKLETWCLICSTYVTITVLLWCFSLTKSAEATYPSISNCFLINFCMFLGTCPNLWPRSKSMKILVLFWLIVCFILDIIYTTKFISLMQLGVQKQQIKTREELLESNLEIWLKPSTVKFFKDSSSMIPFFQKYNDCRSEMNCLRHIIHSKNRATFTTESFVLYIKNQFIGANDLPLFYCFNSGTDMSHFIIGMRKGSGLKEHIDKILHQFVEGGFIQLWRRQTFKSYKVVNGEDSRTKLGFDFFKAPLYCWTVGIVFSFSVFILEHVTKRYKIHTENLHTLNFM